MLRHGNIFCKGTHFFRSKNQVAPFFFSRMVGRRGQIIKQAAAICHDTVETTDFMVSRSRMGKDWQKTSGGPTLGYSCYTSHFGIGKSR